jgi:hypothetical protein
LAIANLAHLLFAKRQAKIKKAKFPPFLNRCASQFLRISHPLGQKRFATGVLHLICIALF